MNEDILQLGEGVHAVEVDVMQPLDPEKSPKVHIPPLNHIGLWVDDLEAAVAHFTNKGKRIPGFVPCFSLQFCCSFYLLLDII